MHLHYLLCFIASVVVVHPLALHWSLIKMVDFCRITLTYLIAENIMAAMFGVQPLNC